MFLENDKIYSIYKPPNIGSTELLNYIKKKYKIKKIGHGGTLDPFAEGILIIGLGKSTKELGNFLECSKEYIANIYLGHTTPTLDNTESSQYLSNFIPNINDVKNVLKTKFTGEIEQIPPVYSAIKINGKRAYDLTRQGIYIEMKSRKINIYNIECLEYNYPILKIKCLVSGGTYIRTLGNDIAISLGCGGGYLEKLVRSKIICKDKEYTIENSIKID